MRVFNLPRKIFLNILGSKDEEVDFEKVKSKVSFSTEPVTDENREVQNVPYVNLGSHWHDVKEIPRLGEECLVCFDNIDIDIVRQLYSTAYYFKGWHIDNLPKDGSSYILRWAYLSELDPKTE